MAKKWFLFGLIWVFSSIVAFGGTNYRISELDALRRLPFEVREKDDNITVPEFDLRAEEYALIVSSLPEELYELQKVDVEIGNSWELFVVGKEKDKEKVILKNLASTFHYLDKESRQTNSFVLAGEQKLVALITESGDMAKLSKFKEKRFFLACHDGGNIFYPRNETIVWEFREMNNVNQKNFQPKGAPFEDGINGISYIKRGSDTDQKIEKLIYSVANSSELGYRGTVLPREDYEEIERTFFEKASGMLKKELINSVPFLSFGLRYGNFRVSKFISSSSLNVANAFVENGSQRQATGLNIYCDNQIAQRVFYRNVTELKRANSIIAQEIFTLKQETARQSNQLAQRQKEAEKLESEIILMGSALAKQERQNQEREFALTEVLRATRGDAERLREENNQFKQQLLAESAMVTNLLEEKTIQSVELAEIKKEFVKIKNSTAIFKARLDKIEEGNKAKDNLLFVNLIRQEKKEQKEIRIAKAGLGFSNYEQNERIPLVSIFGALFLVAFFAINHRGKNRRDRCKRAIMREPKTRAKVRKKFKKEQKPKQKTKRRRKMRKNFFIALFFISVLNFSSLPTAMAQNKDIASKLEVYTPKDNPELFNRLAGQNPELYIEVLKNPKQVIMEVKGVFRPYILASGVKVLADKDGNIKFAQCGNSVIDPGDNKSMSESNEPKNKTDKESKERESLRQDFFLGMYFEQMGTFQKGQQILQARQLLQQEKILEFLTESQRAQQAQSQIIQSQNQNTGLGLFDKISNYFSFTLRGIRGLCCFFIILID